MNINFDPDKKNFFDKLQENARFKPQILKSNNLYILNFINLNYITFTKLSWVDTKYFNLPVLRIIYGCTALTALY